MHRQGGRTSPELTMTALAAQTDPVSSDASRLNTETVVISYLPLIRTVAVCGAR